MTNVWSEVEKLVASRANERKIQDEIKKDLSFFGKAYAYCNDNEYIAFSEFLIPGFAHTFGRVDFVVFSGRSNFDVYLIEIKGANFELLDGDFFGKDFTHGIEQVVSRSGYCKQNYSKFRTDIHDIRDDVESGKIRFNSVLGDPQGLRTRLDKDFNIHYVVIGGKSTDEKKESRKINEWHQFCGTDIRLYSWDSWIRHFKPSS